MRPLTVITLSVALVATATVHVSGQTSDSGSDTEMMLARLQVTYESELGKLEAERETQAAALQDHYAKSLEALQTQLQKTGQLEPILAVRAERERFEQDRRVDADALAENQSLKRIQVAYVAALRDLDIANARRVLDLAGKYDRSLSSLQARATREGKLNEAVLIKTQREDLTTRPEISSARFSVAEAEAEKEQAAAADVAAKAEPIAPVTPAKAYEGDPRTYIRSRFKEFCNALARDDMTKARNYVDPNYLDRKGTDVVNGVLGMLAGPYVKVVRAFHGDLDPGTIVLDEGGQTASHRPRYWAANHWKETRPTYWVEREGDWYIDMDRQPGPADRNADGQAAPTFRPGKGFEGKSFPPFRRMPRDSS